MRYIKTFTRHPATTLIKEVYFPCLDPAEVGWIADPRGTVMDCVYTMFQEQDAVLPGLG